MRRLYFVAEVLFGGHGYVREMRDGSRTDPEPNRSPACPAAPKVVHDQSRLLDAVHKQPRLLAGYFDANSGPLAWYEVCVALVLFRELLAQAVPRKVGERDVLNGVIAADLVVGSTVGRPEIETLEPGYVRRDAECNPDKASGAFERSRRWLAGYIGFDCSIPETGIRDDRDLVLVAVCPLLCGFRNPDR